MNLTTKIDLLHEGCKYIYTQFIHFCSFNMKLSGQKIYEYVEIYFDACIFFHFFMFLLLY